MLQKISTLRHFQTPVPLNTMRPLFKLSGYPAITDTMIPKACKQGINIYHSLNYIVLDLYAGCFLIVFCTMSTPLIQAQHLHRYYADSHAVNDVTIELNQGEILGLLGPNGAGKSSCMQMLCGVLAPSAGQVLINGFDLLDQPNKAKQHIGYLPDKPPLYPELTVDEYLNYAARLRRTATSQIKDYREQAKSRCGLQDHGKRLIGNLSKGYQQRVGIAQAIIHQPKIIILDEPTVGLDPIQMREIRKLITQLGKHHGVILSTHILPEVHAVCNRVQMIHQGKTVFNQSMNELQNNNQVTLHLQQEPSINELLQINGLNQVETLEKGKFLLQGNNLHLILADISKHCVNQNWGLLEISLTENSLEQTFLNLTSKENHTNENEDAA